MDKKESSQLDVWISCNAYSQLGVIVGLLILYVCVLLLTTAMLLPSMYVSYS